MQKIYFTYDFDCQIPPESYVIFYNTNTDPVS